MDWPAALERDGVLVRKQVLSGAVVARLPPYFDGIDLERAGARGFNLPAEIIGLIAPAGPLGVLAATAAGRPAWPVRVVLFDKTPASNWAVPWHQDRTIAVKQRIEVDGYGPWSVKAGIPHVEPPLAIMQGMLTLRVFVDDCGENDGPLEVVLGSHGRGRVAAKETGELLRGATVHVATGQAGDVLVMKTLAIHSSKRARTPAHRRVLHVDYASVALSPPLEWELDRNKD